ncbi:Lipopolysaccharide kinase (Kdo/WaaP) family protein [Halopseudomonas xinjiangensis]|uniref:Lipopolysaccharide kinase (Kdo/WaaP) family protein n=1 Tax=Halopseudomonas xinjiangensis TaxID=487184 RepID=A0A1H1M0T0_9GAMM|nr:lipopolysaccharide kinase InaA family protein [Halopseudomonas xinjiangensis]SDR80444.1 Lipopolysaccharide kinase (Kdo/WaaP) family protein [Halopseudomonas xinjiangensis]
MKLLTRQTFENMRSGARVVEQDHYGEKVLLLSDGTYLKLFRRKSWFSKTAFYPPAKRFADNAWSLATLAIPCPAVLQTYRMTSPYRSVVHYVPLAGQTLRTLMKTADESQQRALLEGLGDFIALLHDKGVYFRSLHFGNIVLTPEQQFGLIDISDMRCLNRPLSVRMRRRNYEHLLRYQEDWDLLPGELLESLQRDVIRG